MSDDENRELLRKAREGDPSALVRLEDVAFRAHGRRIRPQLNVVQATAPFGQVALCVHPARDVYRSDGFAPTNQADRIAHPNIVIHLASFVVQKVDDHRLIEDDLQKRERLGPWDVRPESLRSRPVSVLVNYDVTKHIDGAMKLAFVAAHLDDDDYDGYEETWGVLHAWANRHVPLFLRRWLPQNEDFLRQGRRYAAQIVTKHLMTRFRALQKQYETSRNETVAALQLALELGDDPLTTPRSPKLARAKAPTK